MADRTSAGIFSDIFQVLAEHPITDQHRTWAHKFWKQSLGYDFTPYQMYCDEELIMLGLARRVVDHEGKRVEYLLLDYT